jgi:N-acetylmuramic acid 6-phosphate (MurNAc-6-P) etherase
VIYTAGEESTSEYPVTFPLMPDLINEILVGGGEGLRDNSEGIEISSFQYLE